MLAAACPTTALGACPAVSCCLTGTHPPLWFSSLLADKWGSEEVAAWLEALGLGEYRDIFVRHDIQGSELILLERRDLKVQPFLCTACLAGMQGVGGGKQDGPGHPACKALNTHTKINSTMPAAAPRYRDMPVRG